jgi:hypothetical protein
MKMLVRTLAIASLFATVSSPLAAQGVTGRWITEIERMVRNENGNVSTGEKTKARLVLEQRGDSVTGTWEPLDAAASPGGRAAAPRQLRGTISGNKVSLSTQVEARRNINGEESVRTMTIVYDFTVDGDKLQGTTTLKGSDMEMPARPFSAWRETQPRRE